jgi:chromosome segregation ATPase
VTEEVQRFEKRSGDIQQRYEEAKSSLSAVEATATSIQEQGKKAEANLKDILRQIESNKMYQREQEELLDQAIQAGNERLHEINSQIKRFEQEREDVLAKIHAEGLKIGHLEQQIDTREQDLIRLEERYQDAAAEYRQELANVKMEIAEAQQNRDKVIAETDAKLLELKAERAELEVSREVLLKQQDNLSAEKRRLDSMRAQYGLQ